MLRFLTIQTNESISVQQHQSGQVCHGKIRFWVTRYQEASGMLEKISSSSEAVSLAVMSTSLLLLTENVANTLYKLLIDSLFA